MVSINSYYVRQRCNKLFNSEELKTYDYFQTKFFGMERSLAKIMRFLRSASLKGEESRQVLLLLGPVGAGKSALLEHIKTSLEHTEPMYHIEGCPVHEEPLHLIPRSLREQFQELYGIKVEGDLCPVCRFRLKEEFNNDYKYIKTIGVSLFRQKTSTSRHFGPLRITYRILYNFNKLKKEGSYIEADGRINKWKYDPLFIFDDTLIHQSFNEEDNLRYCAFIDIIRPSHFDNIMKSILSGVGFLLKKTRSIFYKNWKMKSTPLMKN